VSHRSPSLVRPFGAVSGFVVDPAGASIAKLA
jgi:hypothetical protein